MVVILATAAADDDGGADDGGADDGGADDGAGAPTTGLRRQRRAAPPGQKENIEKDTVAGRRPVRRAEPSVMSSVGPLVLWSSACGAMRGHLRTKMRRRQNAISIDRTSDLHFYFLLLP